MRVGRTAKIAKHKRRPLFLHLERDERRFPITDLQNLSIGLPFVVPLIPIYLSEVSTSCNTYNENSLVTIILI